MVNILESVGEIDLGLNINSRMFNNQLNGIAKNAESKVGSIFSGLGKKIGLALGTVALGGFVKDCLNAGSDLAEVQNVVDTTFTTMAIAVNNFAKSASATYGMSETMAKKYMGTFGAMSKSFGFTEQAAYKLSKSLTGLTGDVASFYNLSQDEAYTKLKSIFTGETESLKELGIVMTQTALDQYAMNNGFGKTTAKMTEQEKVMLRYQYVMSGLSSAQGDFAKTSGSWANQTRLLSLQFESLKAALGRGFIAAFTPIIKAINTLMGKLVSLANTFSDFIGVLTGADATSDTSSTLSDLTNSADSASDSMSGIGDSAKKTADDVKKATKSLMGFDKMNKLSEPDADSSTNKTAGTGSLGNIDIDTSQAEAKMDNLSTKLETVKSAFDTVKTTFATGFSIGVGDSLSDIGKIKTSVSSIGTTLKEIFTNEDVVNASKKWVLTQANNISKEVGAFTSIGLTIATNLTGGLSQSLNQNKNNIKKYIIDMFNISDDISTIRADFIVACANIFSVFAGDDAISITSDIITMFSNAFMNVTTLASKFGRDVLSAITKPITDNQEQIKTALNNTLAPLSNITSSISATMDGLFASIQSTFDTKISPGIGNIGTGISNIFSTVIDVYNTKLLPVLNALGSVVTDLFSTKIAPQISNVVNLFGTLFNSISNLFNKVIVPLHSWILTNVVGNLLPVLTPVFTTIANLAGTISGAVNGILTACNGLITFITGVFTLDFQTAWNGLATFMNGIWSTIKSIFSGVGNFFKGVFDTAVTLIKGSFNLLKSFFQGIWNGIKSVFSSVGSWFNGIFNGAVTNIKSVFNPVKSFFSGILSGIKKIFSNVGSWFGEKFGSACKKIKSSFNGITSFFSGMLKGIKDVFSGIAGWFGKVFKGVKDTIVNALTGAVNAVKAPFKAIAKLWNKTLGKISFSIPDWVPGVGGNKFGFPTIDISKFATGGVVDKATPGIFGEAGKEAVVPLKNNTEWMVGFAKNMADRVSANIKIPVMQVPQLKSVQHGSSENSRIDELIELIKLLIQTLEKDDKDTIKLLQSLLDKDINLDGKKITKTVVNNINKTTQSTGKCPVYL